MSLPDVPSSARRTLAIVGRPNVGKSALFNRLARDRVAIVHDQPGITRDRITAECTLGRAPFEIIDTGGIGEIADAAFHERVRAEAELAVAAAGAVALVVDGRAGLVNADREVAEYLRRAHVPTLLVVNKLDEPKHDTLDADFARLGFERVLGVSAAHGRGIGDLVEAVEALLPPPPAPEEVVVSEDGDPVIVTRRRAPRIALVGRPNVGKSSLTNAILRDERTIVSEIPGTTRDAVDVPGVFNGRPYVLVDTAGIRHRARHNTSAEVFSVMRSEKAIERADICILVLDADAGVTRMDRHVGGLIQKASKPCVVALNKWDLAAAERGKQAMKEFRAELLQATADEMFFLSHAPLIALSALKKEGIGKLFESVEAVRVASVASTPTGPLNRVLRDAMDRRPPSPRFNKRFKLLYATRAPDESSISPVPVPTFVFFCNDVRLLLPDYRRYLESKLREEFGLSGLPIRLRLRGREKRGE